MVDDPSDGRREASTTQQHLEAIATIHIYGSDQALICANASGSAVREQDEKYSTRTVNGTIKQRESETDIHIACLQETLLNDKIR
ncbi:hypothetical protein TNCV_1750071 [Trichonephila clavipes]|nr:hypothetical protein TNCV_1750071 [Trichonephila clavipes]